MGDSENIDDISASGYLEKELGIRVISIQNIKTIFNLIKDSLEPKMQKRWLDYYKKYGVIELD